METCVCVRSILDDRWSERKKWASKGHKKQSALCTKGISIKGAQKVNEIKQKFARPFAHRI